MLSGPCRRIVFMLAGLACAGHGRPMRDLEETRLRCHYPQPQLRPSAGIDSIPNSGGELSPLSLLAVALLAKRSTGAFSTGLRSPVCISSTIGSCHVFHRWHPLPIRRVHGTLPTSSSAALVKMLADAAPDNASSSSASFRQWVISNRSYLLLICLILHKCAMDGLTRYTRVAGTYSGSTVATMSEIGKFPLIALSIALLGGGPQQVLPIFKQAFSSKLFSNAWISLCYTFNNLLYFDALSALSAVAYQVLSQSKTLFTAGLMYIIVGKRLIFRQVLAIAMLIAGSILVQLQEVARSGACTQPGCAAAAGPFGISPVSWGVIIVLFSSFISALPNVAYERVLKTEGENQWVNNIQVTIWIMLWIAAANYVLPIFKGCIGMGDAGSALSMPSPASAAAAITSLPEKVRVAFTGFTPAVWIVVLLQSLKGILIPATLKYADNILYAFAKPGSIVMTTILSLLFAGVLPSLSLVLGVSTVVASMFLYSSKPKSTQT